MTTTVHYIRTRKEELSSVSEAIDSVRPLRRSSWVTAWLLVAALHVLMILLQAIFAGQFLSGRGSFLELHRTNAELIPWVSAAQLIVATIATRRSRGRFSIPLATFGLLVAEIVQISAGYGGDLRLHVPLGVAIFGLGLWLLLAAVNVKRGRVRRAAE